MSTAHGIETEVKIRLVDEIAARRRLEDTKFAVSVPRRFEANTLYDTTGRDLKRAQMLLRLRQVGGNWPSYLEGAQHSGSAQDPAGVGDIGRVGRNDGSNLAGSWDMNRYSATRNTGPSSNRVPARPKAS